MSSLQRKRKNKPLFLIDIALPRDIDPKCSEIENVYLFDLDDIRKIVKIKNENYKEDLEKAEILIEKRNLVNLKAHSMVIPGGKIWVKLLENGMKKNNYIKLN